MKGVSTTVVIAGIVVLVVVAGGAFYFVSQSGPGPTQTTTSPTTSTSTSSTSSVSTTQAGAPPGAKQSFNQHLANFEARDIPTTLTDYVDSAVVVWGGNTGGLSGTYAGTGNIRLLLSSALSTAHNITLATSDYLVKNNSASQVTVNATLGIKGNSQYLGAFNGTIEAQAVFTYTSGSWKISIENWFWKSLNGSSSGGATTFPEWQKVGPINPSRRSTDWLHNFAWDYGGPGVAVLMWGFVAALAALVISKSVRKTPG